MGSFAKGCLVVLGVGAVGIGCLVTMVAIGGRKQSSQSAASTAVTAPATTLPPRVDPVRDIDIKLNHWTRGGFGSVGMLDFTVKNMSTTVSYRDIHYRTRYAGESGTELHRNRGVLAIVLKPHETRRFRDVNDGLIPAQSATCAIAILDATGS